MCVYVVFVYKVLWVVIVFIYFLLFKFSCFELLFVIYGIRFIMCKIFKSVIEEENKIVFFIDCIVL